MTDVSPTSLASGQTRRERRMAETRAAIVATARELFDAQGYAETTIDQIATAADVAPRTFFRYFPHKEALLFADFDDVRQALFAAIEARPRSEHPLRSLVAALTEFGDVIAARHADLEWGFRISEEHEVVGVYERTVLRPQTTDRISEFVADRLAVDPATDPRPAAWATLTMTAFGSSVKAALATDQDIGATFTALLGETAATLTRALQP